MEVCTVFDCTISDEVLITTAEALPQGLFPPTVVSDTPSSVHVTWSEPTKPNGILLRYDLFRTTIKKCSEIPPPTMNPEWTKCTYVECPVLQNICGGICYSGAKVCCNGQLYDSKDGYGCCDDLYVEKPSVDMVCCGGKFYTKKIHHQCCGHRYIEVLPEQTCCVDPVENRVTVGYGDACCRTTPYSTAGAQICCKGMLSARYGYQCCGGSVVSDTMICCGDAKMGKVYTSSQDHVCCGQDYSPATSTLCCTSDTGHTKVHIYQDNLAKISANEKCCGIEKVSSTLSCCNYKGYNPDTHVCSDFSHNEQGCGYGNICPISSQSTAFCDRCDFNNTVKVCGSQPGYHGSVVMPTTPDPKDSCVLREEIIYTNLNFSYTDTGLEPYSVYQYAVSVVNSAGDTRSDPSEVITRQWYPDGVAPPTAVINPTQLYVIELTWKIPTKPNGEIIHYILMRDGIELYKGLNNQYTDDTTILPYQSYTYILSACTIVGCTDSDKVTVATAEGKPDNMLAPKINNVASRSFSVTWQKPEKSNGIIKHYLVTLTYPDGRTIVNTTSANTFSLKYVEVFPYTNYTVDIEACTGEGCTKSPFVHVQTLEDLPEGIFPPRLIVTSAISTLVFWDQPLRLNGHFRFYAMMRVWSRGAKEVYFGTEHYVEDVDLTPGWKYSYYLIVGTGVGNTSSAMISVTMPTDMLNNIPAPKSVVTQSATRIYAEWDPVVTSEGTVDQYGLKLNAGLDSEVEVRVGLNLSAVVTGLRPFFHYSVRLLVCLSGKPNSCGIGPAVPVRTLEASPAGFNAPTVKVIAANIVIVNWKLPLQPNGIILQYLVYYRKLGTFVDLLINRVDGDVTTVRHAGQDLLPYTQYQYRVFAGNSMGDVASPWTTVRTLEAPPSNMPRPLINSTHAFGFSLSWQPPLEANGEITEYRIGYRMLSNTPADQNQLHVIVVSPAILYTSISGLVPYSNYEVYISAFNSMGNATSAWTIVQTGQSSPAGMQEFHVEKIDSGTAVILRWDPPSYPYGVIVSYKVYEAGSDVAIYQGLNPEFEFRRLEPYTSYNVQLEACTIAGCTLGGLQSFVTAEAVPTDQPVPTPGQVNATTAQVMWTRPVNPNGVITKYEVLRQYQTRGGIQKRSYSDPVVVYSTTDTDKQTFVFTDTNLQPYTEYQYSIRTSNSKGSTQSTWQSVFTEQAAPEGMASPMVSFVDFEVEKLKITWLPPLIPNGILLSYQLQRNDSVPLSFSAADQLEYLDFNLKPYTVYSYTVKACTTGGCTTSEPTFIRTKEVAPVNVSPPSTEAVNSTTIKVSWKPSPTTHGEITQYRLLMDGGFIYSGLSTTHIEGGLTPYKEYVFALRVCTNGGCTESGQVTVRPNDAPPADQAPPILSVLSDSSIEISWQAPQNPNGIINSYDLRRDGNLIFTDSVAISGTLKMSYVDFTLDPGTEYSYVITARNRRGSVDSLPAKATTYSASPSGLDPPTLRSVSSTSIQATWNPPVKPNGVIRNYTLYMDGQVVYSAGVTMFTYLVPGLTYWTEYTFRIQACTDRGCELSREVSGRTLEFTPELQGVPSLLALANADGAHTGVLITWEGPTKPNGIILRFEVYRREPIKEKIGFSYTPVVLVYNGSQLQFSDYDNRVKPYTEYQYMVSSVNSVGKAESSWVSVFTKEAPPTGVPPPDVKEKTPSTVTVTITPPSNPNGEMRYYSVLHNSTVGSSSMDLTQTIGQSVELKPYTMYAISVLACTAGGCSESPAVTVRTSTAVPKGQGPVRIKSTNVTTLTVEWSYPTQPNGEITRFLLYQRTACPLPQQPFPQSCAVGERTDTFSGLAIEHVVTNLLPYSAYEFQIVSENEAGLSNIATWVRGQTNQIAPLYVKFPLLMKNNSLAVLDWSTSFELNGRLREYILYANDRILFRGVATIYTADEQTSATAFSFIVTVVTDEGQAATPSIVFDPNAIGNVGTTTIPIVSRSTPLAPFYEEMWFIVLLVLIAMLLIFVVIAMCIRHVGGRRPYIRERISLSDRHHKSMEPFPFFDESSGSSSFDEASSMPYKSAPDLFDSSIGASNVGYSHGERRSSPLGKMSFTSSQSQEDFVEDEDFLWRTPHSGKLQFDEEVSTTAAPSMIKEQTVFTDTHV